CLTHTLDLPAAQWRVLDQAHRKRNLAEYEGHLEADNSLVEGLARVANSVLNAVLALGPAPQDGQSVVLGSYKLPPSSLHCSHPNPGSAPAFWPSRGARPRTAPNTPNAREFAATLDNLALSDL